MSPRAAASLLTLAALTGCGPAAKKPADADIAAYLSRSEPSYLQVSGVKTSFEAAQHAGSWRVHVDFTLRAAEDLYAPPADMRDRRAAFDRTVAAFELYRLPRIQAANQLAARLGLMRQGDASPEPAVPVSLVTHAHQVLQDSVTLLAQPDGAGWTFVQASAQSLSDDAIGAPLDDLRKISPHTLFVMAGSDEARAAAASEQRFLGTLAKASADAAR